MLLFDAWNASLPMPARVVQEWVKVLLLCCHSDSTGTWIACCSDPKKELSSLGAPYGKGSEETDLRKRLCKICIERNVIFLPSSVQCSA